MSSTAVHDLRKACHCLYLAAPDHVVDDVKAKAEAVIAELDDAMFKVLVKEIEKERRETDRGLAQ